MSIENLTLKYYRILYTWSKLQCLWQVFWYEDFYATQLFHTRGGEVTATVFSSIWPPVEDTPPPRGGGGGSHHKNTTQCISVRQGIDLISDLGGVRVVDLKTKACFGLFIRPNYFIYIYINVCKSMGYHSMPPASAWMDTLASLLLF